MIKVKNAVDKLMEEKRYRFALPDIARDTMVVSYKEFNAQLENINTLDENKLNNILMKLKIMLGLRKNVEALEVIERLMRIRKEDAVKFERLQIYKDRQTRFLNR